MKDGKFGGEHDPRRKLENFVKRVESEELRPHAEYPDEYHIIDASELKSAIESGQLTNEDIQHAMGKKTIAEEISDLEKSAEVVTIKDPVMVPVLEYRIGELKSLQAVREGYIPMDDYAELKLSADSREILLRDIIEWVNLHGAQFETLNNAGLNPKPSIDEKLLMQGIVGVTASLDYPELRHGFRIDTSDEHNNKTPSVRLIFDAHNAPADMLSALRMVEYFKEKKLSVCLGLATGSVKEGDQEEQKSYKYYVAE